MSKKKAPVYYEFERQVLCLERETKTLLVMTNGWKFDRESLDFRPSFRYQGMYARVAKLAEDQDAASVVYAKQVEQTARENLMRGVSVMLSDTLKSHLYGDDPEKAVKAEDILRTLHETLYRQLEANGLS